MSQRQPSADAARPAGYEATRVDERRLGDTVEATVRRYDDGDILLFDSAQTESPTSASRGAGIVILAPAQAIGFVRLVRRYRPLSAECDPHVGHLPRETRCSLGVDQLGEEVVVERRSTTEIHFSSPDGRQACCLSADQAQDLYEYLADIGCDRRPGGSGAPAAAADTAVGTVPEPTVDLGAADWAPGDPCPGCANQTVHAIVRAGMRWHADGGWDFDETLAIYEAFCPDPVVPTPVAVFWSRSCVVLRNQFSVVIVNHYFILDWLKSLLERACERTTKSFQSHSVNKTMETDVVYEIENVEELQELYQMYGWWEDRELNDIQRAVEHTDEIVGIRTLESGQLLASGRVLTDYVYSGKILDVIVDESRRGKGLGKRVMEAITDHPKLQDVEILTLNCRASLVPFYEDCGFRVHDMTTERPDGTEEDYYLMVQS